MTGRRYGECSNFFWLHEIEGPLLVRNGENVSLGYDADGHPLHTRRNVVKEMIIQICLTYSSLPDVRTMSLEEIEFFYDGIRHQLIKETKRPDE